MNDEFMNDLNTEYVPYGNEYLLGEEVITECDEVGLNIRQGQEVGNHYIGHADECLENNLSDDLTLDNVPSVND